MESSDLNNNQDSSLSRLPKYLQASFYAENPKRTFWLSILSFGLYPSLWFYRHWRHFQRRSFAYQILNIEYPSKYKKDINIEPILAFFFGNVYIIGTARRIRDKLKSIESNQWSTGPWFAFILFGSFNGILYRYQATDYLSTNILLLVIFYVCFAIASWQIARLQRKANQFLVTSKEIESIPKKSLSKLEIFFLVIGGLLTVSKLYMATMLIK